MYVCFRIIFGTVKDELLIHLFLTKYIFACIHICTLKRVEFGIKKILIRSFWPQKIA